LAPETQECNVSFESPEACGELTRNGRFGTGD